MSMARRLRTQENEIIALHKTRRELEQLKTTQEKMLAHRDERISHLNERVETLTRKLDEAGIGRNSQSPKRKQHHQQQGLAGMRVAVPLRGGGKRGRAHVARPSPLKTLCEQAEDQWKNARAAARWGLREASLSREESARSPPPGAGHVDS